MSTKEFEHGLENHIWSKVGNNKFYITKGLVYHVDKQYQNYDQGGGENRLVSLI